MNNDISKLQLYTLNVGLAHHHADWNWKNVRSPFARLYCVIEGTAQIVLPQGLAALQPGHLYFIPPYTTHSYVCDSDFTHYYIHIHEEKKDGDSLMEDWHFPVEIECQPLDVELCERLCAINPQMRLEHSNPATYDNHATYMHNLQQNLNRPFHDKVESRGILFLLMSRFIKLASPKISSEDARIKTVLKYLRKDISQDTSIRSLATMACMSKDHFIRVFKQETGDTPNAYITKRKVEQAESMLINTDLSVKTIAMRLAYDDSAYFVRVFKKITGLSPQQYRKNCNI